MDGPPKCPFPVENVFRELALLLLSYEWDRQELARCGAGESEFRAILAKMRLAALVAGWVEL